MITTMMNSQTARPGPTPDRACARIDLAALRHNLARVRACAAGRQVYTAIKANAYGHGAIRAATALTAADGYAVATLQEAQALRAAGLTRHPVMLLSQQLTSGVLDVCAQHDFRPFVFSSRQLQLLEQYRGPEIAVWIKLDTGMHRLGFDPDQAHDIHARISRNPNVSLTGWATHLACADEPDSPMTSQQVERFEAALAGLPGQRSIANSAGIVAWPATHADVVRPGIMLYGASPMLDTTARQLDLKPAMTLTAPMISIQHITAGEPVGYGATWHAPQDMRIGIIGIGYGDGYPRHAPSGTPVLINGRTATLTGRVSMDMIAVDLRQCPDARQGDTATLWGDGLPAERVAQACGTIAYELFCQISDRVEFSYPDT